MENERGQIEVLEQTRKEIDSKAKKISQLRQEQINILQEKRDDYLGIMEWYVEQRLKFSHPKLKFYNSIGPILGYIEDTEEVIIYHVREKGFFAQELNDSDRRKSSAREIIDTGNFENAVIGFDYLLNMQNDNLKKVDEEIKRLEEELKRVKG
ncbi:hypothetical protein KY998_10790 [Bacillus paralicheniformis]|uniref:hypothetical protein n=1 Tax=Bacillus subtilis group TaxID=653685 RepID=UPI000BA68295|nr:MULTISPECIES: hypothetical protein [Bacillus subtilis group]MBG9882822.1 hypothetical protein [Bacillus paralicheniformis]MCA1180107.1 hypothetical protein [Bacillus licheniformis]MCY7461940.1 hypothetical protein [Bacillus paralicheniformis]MDE1394021.1 hypothetical protein [Bacillus paralicheniformis]MEC1934957.1 hypothetical protein [Bacillus paralicheniformis]